MPFHSVDINYFYKPELYEKLLSQASTTVIKNEKDIIADVKRTNLIHNYQPQFATSLNNILVWLLPPLS